jgi:hypothetical protein
MVHRGHAYVGHKFSKGSSVVDVRDPRHPTPVTYVAAPPNTWNIHLPTADDLLLVINAKDMFAAAEFQDEHAYYKGSRGKTLGTAEGRRARLDRGHGGLRHRAPGASLRLTQAPATEVPSTPSKNLICSLYRELASPATARGGVGSGPGGSAPAPVRPRTDTGAPDRRRCGSSLLISGLLVPDAGHARRLATERR